MPKFVDIVNDGDLLPEEFFLLSLVELRVMSLFLGIIKITETRQRMVELIIGELLQIGLVFDHLREVGIVLGVGVDDE